MKKISESKSTSPKKRRNKNAEKFFMTERFSDRLKKIKAGKKKKLVIKTDDNYGQIEEQDQNDPKYQQMILNNQKHLINLYQSNYTTVFEDLKRNFEKEIQELKTEPKENQKNEILYFSQPKNKKIKYGFEQFNKTSYSNFSCMKEFYKKYSQYNTLKRKHLLKNMTPSWAFIKSTKAQK